jgi:hypothetical protein
MELVRCFTAAVFAVSHFLDFALVEGVEVIELQISTANSAVIKSIFELFTALDILFRDHIKTEDFHKSPPS